MARYVRIPESLVPWTGEVPEAKVKSNRGGGRGYKALLDGLAEKADDGKWYPIGDRFTNERNAEQSIRTLQKREDLPSGVSLEFRVAPSQTESGKYTILAQATYSNGGEPVAA